MISLCSRKKKQGIFGKSFLKFVLSQCIVYWIHFQNIHTFTYQKTLLHTPLLDFKIVESVQCIWAHASAVKQALLNDLTLLTFDSVRSILNKLPGIWNWMNVHRKSIWAYRDINKCYVHLIIASGINFYNCL